MTLEDFALWLGEQTDVGQGITVGIINGNLERTLGVYAARGGRQRVCLGGPENTILRTRRVSILVHWTKDMRAAEGKAWEMYNLLYARAGDRIGGFRVVLIDPGEGPVPLGRDSLGVCEFAIEAQISYERMIDNG